MTDSTTFIGVAAPSTPWIAAASPACSVPTAEPIAWPSASSKLVPSPGGMGACGGAGLRLRPTEPMADIPSIIGHVLLLGYSRVFHQGDRHVEHVGRLLGDLEVRLVAA